MGMSDMSYWLSWFVFHMIQSTILVTIGWAIICINCIGNSNVMYVWLLMWLFGLGVFGQILMFQSFFSKSKFAGICAAVGYFTFYILYFPVSSPDASHSAKMFMGLFPQVAI